MNIRQPKIKKLILLAIPMSVCNLRCHYCYLAQRPVHFEGTHPTMQYSPKQVAYALRPERLGGLAYINLCADGETLLTQNLSEYVRELALQGHFLEIVSNMVLSSKLNEILDLDKDILKQIEFKCSFHYLELKKRDLLQIFADNVNRAWRAGASVNIEITPSDELIPLIHEVKEFSLNHFGALPHLSIARDDRTKDIKYLTGLDMKTYDETWTQFDSEFWKYKKTIFGKYQKNYCYAGAWSAHIMLDSGDTRQCYHGNYIGNAFADPESPFPVNAIGKCTTAHCYNGHALLTLGLIPNANHVKYGHIRDRKRIDGTRWLQPELRSFFDSKLEESNETYSTAYKIIHKANNTLNILGLHLKARFPHKK